jgi:hypothetical protein
MAKTSFFRSVGQTPYHHFSGTLTSPVMPGLKSVLVDSFPVGSERCHAEFHEDYQYFSFGGSLRGYSRRFREPPNLSNEATDGLELITCRGVS